MNSHEGDQLLLLWDFPEIQIDDPVLDAIWQAHEDRMDELLGRSSLGDAKTANLE